MLTPVKILRKIVRRQDRSLFSIGRQPKLLLTSVQTKELLPKLFRSKIGEFRDAMDGIRIEPLVTLGTPEIRLEDGESVIVLLLRAVLLVELSLEEREVVIGVQQHLV